MKTKIISDCRNIDEVALEIRLSNNEVRGLISERENRYCDDNAGNFVCGAGYEDHALFTLADAASRAVDISALYLEHENSVLLLPTPKSEYELQKEPGGDPIPLETEDLATKGAVPIPEDKSA